jgi:two-component sensor histidine kinase
LVGLKEHFADKVAERTAELGRANEALNREIAEKEVLLKEVHHRVKNNLAVIISLLRMQSSRIVDPPAKEALQDCHDRVKAMALVHELLYQSEDLAAIPLASYARALSDNLMQMMSAGQKGTGTRVIIDAEGVRLPIDQAMPCGLILNELITNALKYAFPDREGGQIHISARLNGGGVFELGVQDDGVGLPPNFNLEHCNNLGFRIISALVEHQMEGHWEARNANGARFSIRWPSSK